MRAIGEGKLRLAQPGLAWPVCLATLASRAVETNRANFSRGRPKCKSNCKLFQESNRSRLELAVGMTNGRRVLVKDEVAPELICRLRPRPRSRELLASWRLQQASPESFSSSTLSEETIHFGRLGLAGSFSYRLARFAAAPLDWGRAANGQRAERKWGRLKSSARIERAKKMEFRVTLLSLLSVAELSRV